MLLRRREVPGEDMRKYMVVERYKPGCFDLVYQRYHQSGRMLPQGLYYLNSWVCRQKDVCYQLMETADPSLFESWISHWSDLVDFEIVPID